MNDWDNTVPFIPPITGGKVIKVYDGDTITVASKLPYDDSPLYRFSVRLNGIDCPEMKSHNEDEKKCAKLAQAELSRLLLGQIVALENLETEKYGRILAEVFVVSNQIGLHHQQVNPLSANKHMIDQRFALKYGGGTKVIPKSWMAYHEHGVI